MQYVSGQVCGGVTHKPLPAILTRIYDIEELTCTCLHVCIWFYTDRLFSGLVVLNWRSDKNGSDGNRKGTYFYLSACIQNRIFLHYFIHTLL